MKIIAVTGAQGFVGSAVVHHLRKLGYTVIPVVRKANGTFQDAIEWDITTPYKGDDLNVDVVIHAAAKVDDWATYDDSYDVNVKGTKNVINTFANAKLFIYISSASVYDPTNTNQVITEKSPAGTNLLNSYSKTKYEGELVVLDSSVQSRVVVRPHIIYGPGDKTVLPRLLQARRFGRFLVLGNGKNNISLTYIDNLVVAISQITSSDKIFGSEVFNVVDDKSDTVENIINTLKHSLGINEKNLYIPRYLAKAIGMVLEKLYRFLKVHRSPLITPYLVDQMTSDHVLDCNSAKESFGYNPKVDYQKGFEGL
jgi:nucleoside-diphosphate-sugar epimerase